MDISVIIWPAMLLKLMHPHERLCDIFMFILLFNPYSYCSLSYSCRRQTSVLFQSYRLLIQNYILLSGLQEGILRRPNHKALILVPMLVVCDNQPKACLSHTVKAFILWYICLYSFLFHLHFIVICDLSLYYI